MTVRVKLLIARRAEAGAELETAALVNSGYEAEEPELLLPRRAAEHLGLPLTSPHATTQLYESPFGLYRLLLVPRALRVELAAVGASVEGVSVAISETEREALISDMLAEELGIVILAPARGRWRHVSDPPDAARDSVKPEYW